MELHRLDGIAPDGMGSTGLDGLDIQDIDYEALEVNPDESEMSGEQVGALEALGYVQDPEITYEILDENGNVVMYADAEENLYVLDGLGELGFFKKIGKGIRNASRFVRKKVVRPVSRGVSRAAKFTGKKVLKPVVKTFNRFLNPATILLRNGFLLAMKVNLMKVAERLRFGFLSDTEARRRGISMSGLSKVRSAISKANKIYELAGGKKENLKKAILTGKGNKDRTVPLSGVGLGSPLSDVEDYADSFERMVVEMDADEIEAMLNEGVEIEGLGVVVSGPAIAAASGSVASISALLNKITGVFDKAKKVTNDAKNLVSNARSTVRSFVPTTSRTTRTTSSNRPIPRPLTRFSPPSITRPSRSTIPTTNLARRSSSTAVVSSSTPPASTTPTPVVRSAPATISTTPKQPDEKEGFFQKNKTPLLIGAGVLVVGGGIYYVARQSQKNAKTKPVDGIPRDKKGRFKSTGRSKSSKRKTRKKPGKLVPVALL